MTFNPTKQIYCRYNQHALYQLLVSIRGHKGVTRLENNIRDQILTMINYNFEQQLGYKVESITIARLEPNQQVEIHIDSNHKGELTQQAINLPVTDCSGVFMNWYTVRTGCTDRVTVATGGHKIRGLAREDAERVFTIECNRPLWVQPNTFHDIENKSNDTQLIISVR